MLLCYYVIMLIELCYFILLNQNIGQKLYIFIVFNQVCDISQILFLILE